MAISISAIENEGILLAIILAVTGLPISSWRNFIASRTNSIFHLGKVGLTRRFHIATSTKIMREPMALDRKCSAPAAGSAGHLSEDRASRCPTGKTAAGVAQCPARWLMLSTRLESRHRLWPRERDAKGSNGQNHAAHKHSANPRAVSSKSKAPPEGSRRGLN